MHDIVIYAAAFIFCKQQYTQCMYMGNFHVVVLHLDDKYAQCVRCDKAKHGISHNCNVIYYDEEWHVQPIPTHIGG